MDIATNGSSFNFTFIPVTKYRSDQTLVDLMVLFDLSILKVPMSLPVEYTDYFFYRLCNKKAGKEKLGKFHNHNRGTSDNVKPARQAGWKLVYIYRFFPPLSSNALWLRMSFF